MRLVIGTANGETVASLEDNSVASQLLKMSPMKLEMSDFNNREKIAYPPEKLDLAGMKRGHDPRTGDICVYAPWGNLCVFYGDAEYSDGLVYLGKIGNGLDKLAAEKDKFSATWILSGKN